MPNSQWTTDPLFQKIGSTYYWYRNDHQGTPQKIIGINGLVVWSAIYDSFGNCQIDIEGITNNLRFAGQYYDAETGLHYNLNRYYDPTTGRYLRTDPFGEGLNLYAYCFNNPHNWIDPQGLCAAKKVKDWYKAAIEWRENQEEMILDFWLDQFDYAKTYVRNLKKDFEEYIANGRLYRVEMAGGGGGLGGYGEVGTFTLYDDLRKKAYIYEYIAFGGGWVAGGSGQPETGLAFGSKNPKNWVGWAKGINVEVLAPGYGAGGQVSKSGGNIMYSTGPHVGGPAGPSAVYVSVYTWYVGETVYKNE